MGRHGGGGGGLKGVKGAQYIDVHAVLDTTVSWMEGRDTRGEGKN